MYIKSLTAGKINSPIYIYIYIRCTLSYFFKIKIKIKIAIKRCNKTYRRELRPKQFSTKARDLFVPQKWKKKKERPAFPPFVCFSAFNTYLHRPFLAKCSSARRETVALLNKTASQKDGEDQEDCCDFHVKTRHLYVTAARSCSAVCINFNVWWRPRFIGSQLSRLFILKCK